MCNISLAMDLFHKYKFKDSLEIFHDIFNQTKDMEEKAEAANMIGVIISGFYFPEGQEDDFECLH